MRPAGQTAVVTSTVFLFLGCGGEDDRPPTYEYIHTAILQPNCSTIGCHSERSGIRGIFLDDFEEGYRNLTGVSCGDPNPVDARGTSFRVMGDDRTLRMPPDRPLPEQDIALINQWIADGLPCN